MLADLAARRAAGDLRPDPVQDAAVAKLAALADVLAGYRPGAGGGLFARFRKSPEPPHGLYMWGEVGRGKSMLMDLFFAHAPVDRKRRVHFHAFMQEMHQAVHRIRQQPDKADDPIPPVARMVFDRAWLLCFDEFQVTDIADAMLLGRLFENLFALGVVVVATSNRHPDALYEGGLNRQLFLPFIDQLKAKLGVHHLAGGTDYRLGRLAGRQVWFTPHDALARRALDHVFALLTDEEQGAPAMVKVYGRDVVIPRAARGVAQATFTDICRADLGPADYLAIARTFHTLVLADIPLLGPHNRNEAKRFVILVDALYEAKAKLVASAAGTPEAIYPAGDGAFEFQRTVSRLHEMSGAAWWDQTHIGGA